MDKQEDTAERVDPAKIYDRARELLNELEAKPGCNALLLTYDPNAEKFQFLAMHADADEVYALLLSGLGVLKDAAEATRVERTLN